MKKKPMCSKDECEIQSRDFVIDEADEDSQVSGNVSLWAMGH